jgi:hypothetical protein
MRRVSLASIGAIGAVGLALAVVLALTWATVAQAQSQSSKDAQYGEPVAPSGPAAGAMCMSVQSDDNLLNAGDTASFEGNFSVAPGASLILEDADGTQGTLIDGENAEISSGDDGNIEVAMTGDPLNVVGGDGVLGADVCNSVVTTTGIAAAQGTGYSGGGAESAGTASGSSAVIGVLPDTGGPLFAALLVGFAVVGAGLAIAVHRLRVRD